jgi:hypothetical protein
VHRGCVGRVEHVALDSPVVFAASKKEDLAGVDLLGLAGSSYRHGSGGGALDGAEVSVPGDVVDVQVAVEFNGGKV